MAVDHNKLLSLALRLGHKVKADFGVYRCVTCGCDELDIFFGEVCRRRVVVASDQLPLECQPVRKENP